jgi:hypothetical protein
MTVPPPLPDLPGFFKDLPGVLYLATLVRHAVMMVRVNLLLRGEQQLPGRGHEGEYVLLRGLDVFLRVEQVVFDLEKVITTKGLAAPFPSNLIHGLVLNPVEVRAFAAFQAMLEGYDDLIAHLGWGKVIRPPFDRGSQPWAFPDFPPVEPALLDALDAAAAELLGVLAPPFESAAGSTGSGAAGRSTGAINHHPGCRRRANGFGLDQLQPGNRERRSALAPSSARCGCRPGDRPATTESDRELRQPMAMAASCWLGGRTLRQLQRRSG